MTVSLMARQSRRSPALRTRPRISVSKRVLRPWLLPPNSWLNPLPPSRSLPFRERGLLKSPRTESQPQEEPSPQSLQDGILRPSSNLLLSPSKGLSPQREIKVPSLPTEKHVPLSGICSKVAPASDYPSPLTPPTQYSLVGGLSSSLGCSRSQSLDRLHPPGGLSSGIRVPSSSLAPCTSNHILLRPKKDGDSPGTGRMSYGMGSTPGWRHATRKMGASRTTSPHQPPGNCKQWPKPFLDSPFHWAPQF